MWQPSENSTLAGKRRGKNTDIQLVGFIREIAGSPGGKPCRPRQQSRGLLQSEAQSSEED